MANGKFLDCLKITLSHEGGWADHPKDPGGATMKGVTLETYRAWRPGASKADLKNISDADLRGIYFKGYWNPVRGDALPAGVDLAVFDYGVNSGVSRSAKALQAVVGAAQDGVVGPATVEAVGKKDPADVVVAVCARRLSFVRGLTTWATFGKGWARRIAEIEANGVAMALISEGRNADYTARALSVMSGDASAKSKAQAKAGDGVGVGGAGSGGLFAAGVDVNWWVIGALVVVGLAAFVAFRSRSSINAERAAAYAAEAAK